MSTILRFLKTLFATLLTPAQANAEDQYLADATDLADLEHRMVALERSRRPAFGY